MRTVSFRFSVLLFALMAAACSQTEGIPQSAADAGNQSGQSSLAGTTDTRTASSTGGTSTTGGVGAAGGVIGNGTAGAGGSNHSGGTQATSGVKAGGGTSSTAGSSGTVKDGGTSVDDGGTSSDSGVTTATIPGSGCTPPAAYANLFASLSGHTQEDANAKIAAAWSALFDPSGQNTIYYDGPGSDESYVEDINNSDVRSEGMSYGMMIAVQLDKQTEFDRLWTWVKKHMANGTGQICWQNRPDGSKMSGGGAPDGEEYFATALVFASKRWGNSGKYDYASEARWILNLIRTTYFNSSYHIVRFVAGSADTDASYILPAFYQVWACFDTANAEYWNEAVKSGRNFFHNAIDSNGVIGDHSSFTGQTTKAAGPDTIRCVANIMMDHNFFDADPWQTETYAPKYGAYVSSSNQNSTAASSCSSLLGFGLPASSGKSFVDTLWSMPIPTGRYRYYDGCWYMMALLHVSGTFRLWY
jgi:oligosaccharide reducing-end xylanase